MSYLACHAMKFSGSLKGIENHIERKTAHSKNKDIKREDTAQNFDALTGEKIFAGDKVDYEKKFSEIMEDHYKGKRRPRKDAVKMISFVVTSDKEFFEYQPDKYIQKFFNTAANFLKERYPHVISAAVHMDETTPHMHMCVVPLTNDGRLCAKELLDRNALKEIQAGLPEELKAAGFEIQRGITDVEKKHQTTDEFKRGKAAERIKEIEETELNKRIEIIKEARAEIEKLKDKADKDLEWADILSSQKIKALEKELAGAKKEISAKDSEITQLQGQLTPLQQKIIELETAAEFTAGDIKRQADKITELQGKVAELKGQSNAWEDKYYSEVEKNTDLLLENNELKFGIEPEVVPVEVAEVAQTPAEQGQTAHTNTLPAQEQSLKSANFEDEKMAAVPKVEVSQRQGGSTGATLSLNKSRGRGMER